MSHFEDFNAENKLRLPLTMYAAQIIETDYLNFSLKKTTLINIIILNYHRDANCSIGSRLKAYREELVANFKKSDLQKNETAIQTILSGRQKILVEKYTKRKPADINWQITLNKKVKELLTMDPSTDEERYYGNRPGHYIRALIEEYAQLPYYKREEIVFQHVLHEINDAINNNYQIKLVNNKGAHLIMKPYKIDSDPLSMYHYLVGYVLNYPRNSDANTSVPVEKVQSIRVSRITNVETLRYQSSSLSYNEEQQLLKELKNKGIQFVSGEETTIKVWLSDFGIKKYNSQLHLRPLGSVNPNNKHLYTFECTEAQVLYYFFSFGHDAKILVPTSLADRFTHNYKSALDVYLFDETTKSE